MFTGEKVAEGEGVRTGGELAMGVCSYVIDSAWESLRPDSTEEASSTQAQHSLVVPGGSIMSANSDFPTSSHGLGVFGSLHS